MKTNFQYNIIHSRRKTIALIVGRDGKLTVRAPLHMSQAQILAFIEKKEDWIRSKQAQAQQRMSQITVKKFIRGETFLYLGSPYPLEIIEHSRTPLTLQDGHFLITQTALPRAKEVMTAWYKNQSRQVIEERVRLYAARYNLSYKQIRVSSARTRWGSCSTTGAISFTWRLVMAPLPVIDYVVIHELAHLIERNHSKKFWDQVFRMMGDYTKYVRWLKENGFHLTLE